MEPAEVVDAFIAAIERKDTAAAAAMCADDVSYENMPIDPIVGRAGVEQTLASFLAPAEAVDWPVSAQWTFGRTVVNERLDRFKIGTGWLELPVAGVFEVNEDDQISLWRDYFDMATYARQLQTLTADTESEETAG